jgi:hypothetical protein
MWYSLASVTKSYTEKIKPALEKHVVSRAKVFIKTNGLFTILLFSFALKCVSPSCKTLFEKPSGYTLLEDGE